MLKNYLLITARLFRRHALYAFLNVFGLALGLVVVLLVALFVRFELSFDRFHEKADRTYRIVQEQPGNVYLGTNRFAVTPAPLEDAIRDGLGYVEAVTQINDVRAMIQPDGGRGFYEDGLFATPSFFDVFDFRSDRADPATALAQPNTVLITRELARKVFGTEDVVGRVFEALYYRDRMSLTVTGLIDAPPPNSHLDFSYVISYVGNENRSQGQWGSNSYYTYAALAPGTDPARFEADVQEMVRRNIGALDWIEDDSELPTFFLQRLTDIHLRSHINFEISANGDSRYVVVLSFITLLIILTACINYMNLATARAGTRSREVGVRKVSGADRTQLARQFLGESAATAMIATALAVVATIMLLPAFNAFVDRDIPTSVLTSGWFIGAALIAGLAVGIVAGTYPALYLSRMSPARVLKSAGSGGRSRSRLRNTLVVLQFSVGVFLVVGTIVIRDQLEYIRRADTGMNRDHVVAVTVRDSGVAGQWATLRAELSALPGVLAVSSANHMPTNVNSSNRSDDWDGREGDEEVTVYVSSVNYGLIEMLGLEVIEGRSFSEDFGADAQGGLIINETARRVLGWETAVGKRLDLGSAGSEVIGVVRDFQFHSFHLDINPLALYLDADAVGRVLVKVASGRESETLADVERVFGSVSPAYPFEFQFLDDAYNSLYSAEQKLGTLLAIVTSLTVVIACLGLFGLAAFMALQRTKEIGVRKVLGAGFADISMLLSRDFGKLVLVAFVIGSPLAWFVMNDWLSRFAFRTEIGVGTFVLAGLVTAAAAFAAVGYQSVKASRSDPVKALRYE